jgi:hypothetical protein
MHAQKGGHMHLTHTRIATLVLLCLLVLSLPLWAGSGNKVGTAGAQELRIPVGSVATALAGANIATTSGVEALYWNPAGVAALPNTEALFSYMTYIANIKVNFAGVTANLGNFGSVGVSAKVLNIGDMEVTTEMVPDGTGEIFNPTFMVLGGTYARRMTDRVYFGGTFQYVYEKIRTEQATGMAFDFGIQYDTKWRGVRFGLVMKNFGPDMTFSGPGFEQAVMVPGDDPQATRRIVRLVPASFELPTSVQMGISMNMVDNEQVAVTPHLTFQSNNFAYDEFRLGVEGCFLKRVLALRAGLVHSEGVKEIMDQNDNYIYGLNLGAGLNVPIGQSHLLFDYGWGQTDFFDDISWYTIRFTF